MKMIFPQYAITTIISLFLMPVFAQQQEQVLREEERTDLPELNLSVLGYVSQNMGKRVGNGECWTLAANALDKLDAQWDGNYIFGKEIDPKVTMILPGDIIQFEGVEAVIETPSSRTVERMPHHTAIIHAVKNKTQLTLAHQNYGQTGKKVGLSELDLSAIVKGSYIIFRPVQ